ncbi:MAG: hypothetical protein ABFD25_02765 [Clostridiaceae bacterium]
MSQIAANKETGYKRKKSVPKKIAVIFLVLLLLPVLLAGLLYLYVNAADFEYDDHGQVVSQAEPMSFSERNSFDSGSMTQIMRLDNADLYFLLKDIMPELHYSEDLYINAYRIALEDKAIYLQGKAYGINVPVRLDIDTDWNDGKLHLKVCDAYLGSLCIPVPIGFISEKLDFGLEYELPFQEIPMLKTAKDIYIKDGFLQAVFPVDRNIVMEGFGAWVYLKPATIYMAEQDDMVALVSDIQRNWTKDGYKSPRLSIFMEKLQKNPDAYQELKVKMLAASPEKYAEAYFSQNLIKPDIMARFYPGITRQAVDEMRKQMYYIQNYEFITRYAYDIDEKFGKGTTKIRNGKFINAADNSAIEFSSLFGESPEAQKVFPEGTKFCAVLCEGAQSKQKIGRLRYGSATAVQFKNGHCMVICKKDGSLYYNEISAEEYEDIASGKTPVYIAQFNG